MNVPHAIYTTKQAALLLALLRLLDHFLHAVYQERLLRLWSERCQRGTVPAEQPQTRETWDTTDDRATFGQ